MDYWKEILALAVLVLPLAYCSVENTRETARTRSAIEIACIEQRGELQYGKCTFGTKN